MKKMITLQYTKTAIIFALMVILTACAGKGKLDKEPATSDGQPVVDMTRPPNTIENSTGADAESNPDETISFEAWKKKQETDE